MTNASINTVEVVPLAAAHKSIWLNLWSQYNSFYGRSGETALSPEVVDTTWKRLLDPAVPIAGLVAVQEGELVGLCHAVFHYNLIQLRQTCYMQDLFTSPNARGAGVARMLIAGLTTLCQARDVTDINWHTQSENAAARRLYDRIARDTNFIVYRMKAA